MNNIFTITQAPRPGEERFETLLQRPGITLERICSNRLEAGEWYDQAADEWVLLVRGSATLEFENGELCAMGPGDYLLIPARKRHRVAETSDDALWLAVHL